MMAFISDFANILAAFGTALIEILPWWVAMVLLGLIAFPLARRFFKSFPDEGYIFAKGLGLSLACFINWWMCHLLRFSILSVLVSILLVAAASVLLNLKNFKAIGEFFKQRMRLVIVTEMIFLGSFLLFAFIRMNNPDIASTEKLPDFAFLNGIVTSDHFPPKDPWYAGSTINYFYYGHYQIGFLTKLSGIPTEYTYNLGIAFLFAMTLLAAFGVTYALTRKLSYGFLGGLFVAFIGNLDAFFQFADKVLFGAEKFYPFNWFNWWMSSRVIVREGVDVTINEFPFWSYILGDLHAHVNVVPFSILAMAVMLELFRSASTGWGLLSRNDYFYRMIIAAIALGVIPAANTWDTPTYFGFMVMALVFGRQFALKGTSSTYFGFLLTPFKEIYYKIAALAVPKDSTKKHPLARTSWIEWVESMSSVIFVIMTAVLMYIPFHIFFRPKGTQGIRVVNPIQWTLADDFITIYGFFFSCFIVFLGGLFLSRRTAFSERLRPIFALFMVNIYLFSFVVFGTFMLSLCFTMLIFMMFIPFKSEEKDSKETFFVLFMVTIVLLILIGCEFFYLKDAYGGGLERQNTIFKFYYQAWIFCGIASAYAVYWYRKNTDKFDFRAGSILMFLFILTLGFPIFGTTVKCNHFASLNEKSANPYSKYTMEGIYYMSWRYKGDYQTIQYLKKHAQPNDRVLEATGPAFSHYSRISASTGLSTIVGWANHENIWRDGTWAKVNKRVQDVKEIYSTHSVQRARELLDEYKINYVLVGILEREQYKDADFLKFGTFMEKLLELTDSDNQTTYLYKYTSDF
ncbi:hypothetical protein JW979_15200 [bacterium]|nr:hypothetical protein [candidate division CSSED10-310 bacterium]